MEWQLPNGLWSPEAFWLEGGAMKVVYSRLKSNWGENQSKQHVEEQKWERHQVTKANASSKAK